VYSTRRSSRKGFNSRAGKRPGVGILRAREKKKKKIVPGEGTSHFETVESETRRRRKRKRSGRCEVKNKKRVEVVGPGQTTANTPEAWCRFTTRRTGRSKGQDEDKRGGTVTQAKGSGKSKREEGIGTLFLKQRETTEWKKTEGNVQ